MKPRASHRCCNVTGSNPVEVLSFQASIHNCLNCVHNYDDHSLLDFKSAVLYMKDSFVGCSHYRYNYNLQIYVVAWKTTSKNSTYFPSFNQSDHCFFGVVFIRCCSLRVLELLGSFSNDDGKRHLKKKTFA